ncbi:MAG: Omp28-related outer membrane protein [Alistipes sp.]|nr:Omp28-related outer membrane protein [Alistipes sp.]
MRIKDILFAVVAMLFASCGELVGTDNPTPGTPVPHLSVGIEGIITLDAQGGDVAIPYTISEPVEGLALEATTQQDWIGNITIEAEAVTLFVDANNSREQRVGMVTLTYGEESITLALQQSAAEVNENVKFTITTDRKMAFTSKGGHGTIAYTIEDADEANPQPSAEVDADWVRIDEVTAEAVNFTVGRNSETQKRSTKISLKYKGQELTVFIDQDAASNEVTLSVDKRLVKQGDEVAFTVVYEGEDVTASSTIHANYTNEEVSNPYTTPTSGDLSFYAKYNGIKSKLCSVTVTPAYAPEFPEDSNPESYNFNQRLLMVDHTGLGCGYCPYMKEAIKEAEANANYKDKFNVVYSYSYSSSEVCYTSAAKTLFNYYQNVCKTSTIGMYLTGYPSICLNYQHNTAGNYNMVQSQINEVWDANPTASIALAAKIEGEKIVVSASVKSSKTQNVKLSLWVLEDDIYGTQSNATASWMHTHHSVMRDAPTGVSATDISGVDFGYVEANTTLSRVMEFDLFAASSWKRDNFKVIAIISAPSEKYDNKYEVVNTAICEFGSSIGFDYKK